MECVSQASSSKKKLFRRQRIVKGMSEYQAAWIPDEEADEQCEHAYTHGRTRTHGQRHTHARTGTHTRTHTYARAGTRARTHTRYTIHRYEYEDADDDEMRGSDDEAEVEEEEEEAEEEERDTAMEAEADGSDTLGEDIGEDVQLSIEQVARRLSSAHPSASLGLACTRGWTCCCNVLGCGATRSTTIHRVAL
jgi:hypothetical protein